MNKCMLLFVSSLFLIQVCFAENKEISLATLNWEPYAGEMMDNYGFTSEIVVTALKQAGYTVNVTFMSWKRVLRSVEQGTHDAAYPAYYSDERAKTYMLSDAFASGPLGFYKLKVVDAKYTTLESLKPYKIGLVSGYVNTRALDKADYLNKEVSDDDEQNLKKLLFGRIDLAVTDKFTGQYLIKTKIPEAIGKLVFMEPPLEIKPLYLAISRKHPKHAMISAAFNKAIKAMQADGTMDRIIEKYFSDSSY